MKSTVFKDNKVVLESEDTLPASRISEGSYLREDRGAIHWYKSTRNFQLMSINPSDVPAPIKALCMLMELEV